MVKRLGLFGGSFDPIHRGHIDPVLAAKAALDIEMVLYLPTARPPHKPGRELAPALARYCMVEMALLDHADLRVSDYELTDGRNAYTVDTVEHFARERPDTALYLFVGADSYLELDQWRRWRDLLRSTTLVVLARPGADLEAASPELRSASRGAHVEVMAERLVDLSSTALRERLRRGERPGPEVLPAPVLDYCSKYSLYR